MKNLFEHTEEDTQNIPNTELRSEKNTTTEDDGLGDDIFSENAEADFRTSRLPLAPEPDVLDENDGIFMSWPGAEEAEEDDSIHAEADSAPNAKQKKKQKKDRKKDTASRNAKKNSIADDAPDPIDSDPNGHNQGTRQDDDPVKDSGDSHTQYAFRRAARSDMEESTGKKSKPSAQKHDNSADNEATLSSIKYYKHTQKLKQLVVHRMLPIVLALVLISGFVIFFFRLQHLNFVNLTGYAAEDVFHAAGIQKNNFIFSISSSDIENRLRTRFPYIQSVTVERKLPDTVNLVFEEDCALFYTQIYNEYFVISESMRVLGRYDSVDELDEGLRAVTLSTVSYAVVGHSLSFYDSSYLAFLKNFLAVLEDSDIYSHITAMDISNRFDLKITYDDRLQINLGNDEYLASNLGFVKGIIESLDPRKSGEINIIDNKSASFSETTNS